MLPLVFLFDLGLPSSALRKHLCKYLRYYIDLVSACTLQKFTAGNESADNSFVASRLE